MRVESLGYRTDLIFPAFDGEIVDRGDHLIVRTPANPTFYWGNFLLFDEPPREGDLQRWRELFTQEVGGPPTINHQAFGWDSPKGDQGHVTPFLDAGFRLERGVVLTAESLRPPVRHAEAIEIRALVNEADWTQAFENQVACRDEEFEETEYRAFWRRQVGRYRKMAESGLGDWYGAFMGERLVADLGIFTDGVLGRFQAVGTHPDFRRRGIARSLVSEAGRLAMARHGVRTLVIVADEDSEALRLYKSVGFEAMERQVGVGLW